MRLGWCWQKTLAIQSGLWVGRRDLKRGMACISRSPQGSDSWQKSMDLIYEAIRHWDLIPKNEKTILDLTWFSFRDSSFNYGCKIHHSPLWSPALVMLVLLPDQTLSSVPTFSAFGSDPLPLPFPDTHLPISFKIDNYPWPTYPSTALAHHHHPRKTTRRFPRVSRVSYVNGSCPSRDSDLTICGPFPNAGCSPNPV